MKAIIVEDSRLARNEIVQMLKKHPEIEIIGQAENINVAKQKIEALNPDFIFLDINMPGGDGFELLEKLQDCPQVIFTTAYDEYAIKAFEYNALDYLLKPINPKRLQQALDKMQLKLLDRPEKAADAEKPLGQKLFVKDGERCWLIKIADIRYFESCGNYARIYFDKNKPMIYKSLNKIEERINPELFVRTSRQYIVNINYIAEIESNGNTGLLLIMQDGRSIEVSRRYTTKFKQLLSL
jgi:two-component system, LytTR family, response regulator